MAITKTHWELLKELHRRGELPQGGAILEIGKANVYGDFDTREIGEAAAGEQDGFALTKLIYWTLFGVTDVVSIDAGEDGALRLDLNRPVTLDRQFDVTINHGTAEHVFQIGNVFKTIHANTKAGGLMIHECPFTGWLDHGFYCLQPTLFWDVAEVNGYEMVLLALEHWASATYVLVESREQVLELKRRGQLADGLMLFVAMRKVADKAFVVPIQGVYAGRVSEAAALAWKELR